MDLIDGLSPAISIEQKTTSRNPRFTVDIVTEIYDYMRLLWAHIDVPHAPAGRGRHAYRSHTISDMVVPLMTMPAG